MEFPELLQHHGLSEGDCDKPVGNEHLEIISRSCCKQWKFMPPHLKVDTTVAEDIDKSAKGEREKRYDFLLQWKGIKGSHATYKQLITALMKMKCGEEAERVCEVLKKPLPPKSIAQSLPSKAPSRSCQHAKPQKKDRVSKKFKTCKFGDTISDAPIVDSPPFTSPAICHHCTYLKNVYKNSPISSDSKWPPTPSREFISLALVEGNCRCRDEYIGHILRGNIKALLDTRKEISVEKILESGKGKNKLRLVLVEGAPGIGKSTLAWELCRKWEEYSCMQKYRLVILLRLREVEVQKIESIDKLCCSYESEDRKALAKEVSESQGRDILFILDGFDELPKQLKQKGFLLDLIKGYILPESTVLVTSRPSATGELLTNCRPQIQKHVEVLGFTQESVEAYASSILEPEKLLKFKDYISASDNPGINSLMYIPLNAAIIIEIYRNCQSDKLLPHTIAELYAQICLTILTRYLKIHYPSVRAEKFECLSCDLPCDLYKKFLRLSEMAFKGVKKEEVILHAIPSCFEHFGFLDAVPSLYGGGSISYNFLHLTVQEFFAAYHISHLDLRETEVLCEQYGKNKQWNVVWRFVAHLMKFDKFNDLYKKKLYDQLKLYFFLFRCLIGEETMVDFSSSLRTTEAATVVFANNPTPQYAYDLGCCIAKFFSGASWDVRIMGGVHHTFMCGLQTNVPPAGVIKRLDLRRSQINFVELVTNTSAFRSITCLQVLSCNLTNADMVHLSELIPHLPCLETLVISGNRVTDGKQDGLLKVLHQLYHSNVTVLGISNTGLGELLKSPHDYSPAIKALASEKLEKLSIGEPAEDSNVDSLIAHVLAAPLSLNEVHLHTTNLSPHMEHLRNNDIPILVLFHLNIGSHMPELVDIIHYKKTLQHLTLYVFRFPEQNAGSLRPLVNAIRENKILQSICIHTTGLGESHEAVSGYLAAHYEELTTDSRISWKDVYGV